MFLLKITINQNMAKQKKDNLISYAEFARLHAISWQRLNGYVKQGRVKITKQGGKKFIDKDAVILPTKKQVSLLRQKEREVHILKQKLKV